MHGRLKDYSDYPDSAQVDEVSLSQGEICWNKENVKLSLPVTTTYKPSQIKEAIEHYARGGKVLLDFN